MKKVLLVNDSKFENIILKDMLGSIGYNAIAADEFDAVAKIESFYPDYIIINRIMKAIRGDQLALEIKKHYPQTKCILSSCDTVSIDEINKAGIDAVIKTPIDKERLKTVLASIDGLEPVQYKSKETHSVQGNICMSCECTMPVSEGTRFSFCPFCGHSL